MGEKKAEWRANGGDAGTSAAVPSLGGPAGTTRGQQQPETPKGIPSGPFGALVESRHMVGPASEPCRSGGCLVPGCTAPPESAGRVCTVHASLPAVVLEGTLQGYCERCGTFHQLRCFDTIDTNVDSTQHCCSEELGARRAPETPQEAPPAQPRWPAPGHLGAESPGALSLWQPEAERAPAAAPGGPPDGSVAAWLAQARALADACPPPYRPSGLRFANLSIKIDCPSAVLLEAVRAEGAALLSAGAVEGTLELAIRPGCALLSLAALFPGQDGGGGGDPAPSCGGEEGGGGNGPAPSSGGEEGGGGDDPAPSSGEEEEEEEEEGEGEGERERELADVLLGGRNPLRARLEALLARRGPLATLLRHRGALVQAGGELALVAGGRVRTAAVAGDALPAIASVSPRCVCVAPVAEEKGALVRGTAAAVSDCASPSAVSGPRTVVIRGRRVAPPAALLCQQRGRHLAVEVHAFGSGSGSGGGEERLPAQEWATLWPLGLVPGSAELEVRAGNLLSAARPLLVLPSAAAAAEANALVAATEAMAAAAAARRVEAGGGGRGGGPWADEQRAAAAAAQDAFLREVGLVAGWLHRDVVVPGAGPPPPCSPPLLRHVAATARRLAGVAAARGCAALTALLLEGACADGSAAAEAVAAMDAACPPSLLHTVAGSGSPEVVGVLREWADACGLHWRLAGGAAGTLSAVHVAAVRPDGGAMVRALAALDPAAAQQLLTGGQPGGVPPALVLARAAAAEGQACLAGAALVLPGGVGQGAGEEQLANGTAPGPLGADEPGTAGASGAARQVAGAGRRALARAGGWQVLWWALALAVAVCAWWLATLQHSSWRA